MQGRRSGGNHAACGRHRPCGVHDRCRADSPGIRRADYPAVA